MHPASSKMWIGVTEAASVSGHEYEVTYHFPVEFGKRPYSWAYRVTERGTHPDGVAYSRYADGGTVGMPFSTMEASGAIREYMIARIGVLAGHVRSMRAA